MNPYVVSIPIAIIFAVFAGLIVSSLIAFITRKDEPSFFALLAFGSVVGFIVFLCSFPLVTMAVAFYTRPFPFSVN